MQTLSYYLKQPDKLFRRVRDEHGQLKLSKNAKAYHPGQGVYRSSYKNARRLASTEANIAYHKADEQRWSELDFVVGYEIVVSEHSKRKHDICDDLAGRYPKTFQFSGWHPHCRCHAEPILMTEQEIAANNARIMLGLPPITTSVNTVKDVPNNFTLWVQNNQERMAKATSQPYFIRDNKTVVDNILNPKPKALTTLEKAKIRHDARTPEDINRIKKAAQERQKRLEQEEEFTSLRIAANVINKQAREWGLNTYNVDAALTNKDLKGAINAIKELSNQIKVAKNEYKEFVSDATNTIKLAKQNNIDSTDMTRALSEIKLDKRNWIMAKASFKQALSNLKNKIVPQKTAVKDETINVNNIKDALLKIKDPANITETEVKTIIKKLAGVNPHLFNGGLADIKITGAKDFNAFMAIQRSYMGSNGGYYKEYGNTLIISKLTHIQEEAKCLIHI